MDNDWTPLRAFAEQFVNDQIAAEPDRRARAVLTYNRERIVEQVELGMMRRFLLAPQPAQPRDLPEPTIARAASKVLQ
jgi:hypothetical protein